MDNPLEVRGSHSLEQDLVAVFHRHLKDAAQNLAKKRFRTWEKQATQEISAEDIEKLRKIFERCFTEESGFEDAFLTEFGGE